MNKRLSIVGNSFAIIIDKPIRALLGIGRDSILRVSTDGRRILIEPTGERHEPAFTACAIDAPGVFDTLVRQYGFWQPQFDQLCPKKMRILTYRGGLELDNHDDETRITMRRLEVCLRQRMADAPWEDAIRVALETVP